jgi:CHAP domain
MSIDTALQRVAAINQAAANPASLVGASVLPSGGTAAPLATSSSSAGESSFASALQNASSTYSPAGSSATGLGTASLGASNLTAAYGSSALGSPTTSTAGGEAGQRIVAAAESQIGQTEQPPGSNESPAIAEYRASTEGASPGAPWCAYFASWAARQAGDPIGSNGQGLGSVSEIWSWAQSAGRAVANGPGLVPKPGDLIVFGSEHVGIVKGVLPNGSIETIEGNYNNQVSANVRPAGEATGYVSMS